MELTDKKTLTLVFLLDNDTDYNISISDPKDDVTKTQTDEIMQKFIDADAILKDGHHAAAINTAYTTTTTYEAIV